MTREDILEAALKRARSDIEGWFECIGGEEKEALGPALKADLSAIDYALAANRDPA